MDGYQLPVATQVISSFTVH